MQNKNLILRSGEAVAFTKFQSEGNFDSTYLAIWHKDDWEEGIWKYMVLQLYFTKRARAPKDQVKHRELKHIELICYYDGTYLASKDFTNYKLALDYTLERKEGYHDY